MPLNVPKTYKFTPNPVGPVKMISRSSRRSRLWAGGSFWRSKERGEAVNLIQITCVEDTTLPTTEAVLVVHNTVLKNDEQIFASGFSAAPIFRLFELNLLWDEEIHLVREGDRIVARKYGIRWQIAGAPTNAVRAELGEVSFGRLFRAQGVSFKVEGTLSDWPSGATVALRPRVHRYHLVETSVTDPTTTLSTTGWDIDSLRATLNGSDNWVRMPSRSKAPAPAAEGAAPAPTPAPQNEDGMDDGMDAQFLTPFTTVNMSGGDGLPANPVGRNTGPDRVLVHLNYAELDNGSLGVLNHVYEWDGESATEGSWQRYA